MSRRPIRIAVAGAGTIGRSHIAHILDNPAAELSAVVDPAPAGRACAQDAAVPCYDTLADLLATRDTDAVILATPNTLHLSGALECIAARMPVLVEKPVTATVDEARELLAAHEGTEVPVLVGHHRRHSPLLAAARRAIADGLLGQVVAVLGTAMFYKPDEYFDVAPWRREPGGGPVLINMVHEADDLQALCGDIVCVQATASSTVRGFAVEDTAAATLTFANGALGTFLLSDAAASSWSWEQTSGENPAYPSYPEDDCYLIAGTRGSLAVPSMTVRRFPGTASWWEPFETVRLPVDRSDPLTNELQHFVEVVRDGVRPAVSIRDGMRSLQVTLAIAEAARTGGTVQVDSI